MCRCVRKSLKSSQAYIERLKCKSCVIVVNFILHCTFFSFRSVVLEMVVHVTEAPEGLFQEPLN